MIGDDPGDEAEQSRESATFHALIDYARELPEMGAFAERHGANYAYLVAKFAAETLARLKHRIKEA